MQDVLPFGRIKVKQRTAPIALLRGSDYSQAADEADVTSRTIRRWFKLPDFQEAFRAARVDFYAACRSQVVAARAEAFEALRTMARYSSSPGETVRSSMFLVDYRGRPEMSESLARRDAITHRFNKLGQFTPGKAGQVDSSGAKTERIAADFDFPVDDAS